MHLPVLLMPCPRYAGGIWKRRFHSENASNVFRPHCARGIWKRNNHRSFWICVWRKFSQGNHMIIVIRFRKAPFSKCFPSTHKTKRWRLKFLWFEERFRKAPFSRRISVDGRLNRRKKGCVFDFSGVVVCSGRCLNMVSCQFELEEQVYFVSLLFNFFSRVLIVPIAQCVWQVIKVRFHYLYW